MNDICCPPTPGQNLRALAWAALGAAAFYGYFANFSVTGWHHDSLADVISAVCLRFYGHDEHGVKLPVVALESVGDFKAPSFAYLNALAFFFVKPSVYVARGIPLGFGLADVATLIAFARKATDAVTVSWFGPPFFAFGLLSSWLLAGQNFPAEPSLAVFCTVLGVWTSTAIIDRPGLLKAGLLFGLANGPLPYAYWNTKFLFVANPVLVLIVLAWHCGRDLIRPAKIRGLLLGLGFKTCLGLSHLLAALFHPKTLARAASVLESGPLAVVSHFLAHISPVFLFFHIPPRYEYQSTYGGALSLVFLPFILIGLWESCRRILTRSSPRHLYLVLLLPVAFLPAALTRRDVDFHNMLRTLIAFVPLFLLAFVGAQRALAWCAGRADARALLHALLLVKVLFGGFEAYKSVAAYSLSQRRCQDLSRTDQLVVIPKDWNDPVHQAACDDFSYPTTYYRYYRLIELGDRCYGNHKPDPDQAGEK
jgi:hypothetical protein